VHTLTALCPLWVYKAWRTTLISLFIPAAVVLIAGIGSALFNPALREKTDEERGQLMEDIARSYF
jgi:hypothetical protein